MLIDRWRGFKGLVGSHLSLSFQSIIFFSPSGNARGESGLRRWPCPLSRSYLPAAGRRRTAGSRGSTRIATAARWPNPRFLSSKGSKSASGWEVRKGSPSWQINARKQQKKVFFVVCFLNLTKKSILCMRHLGWRIVRKYFKNSGIICKIFSHNSGEAYRYRVTFT